jgi:hypothetical protein
LYDDLSCVVVFIVVERLPPGVACVGELAHQNLCLRPSPLPHEEAHTQYHDAKYEAGYKDTSDEGHLARLVIQVKGPVTFDVDLFNNGFRDEEFAECLFSGHFVDHCDCAKITVAEILIDGLLAHDLVVDERYFDCDHRSSGTRFERAVN